MERSLVRSNIHMNMLFRKPFPKVNDVAHVCQRDCFLSRHGLADPLQQLVQVVVEFIHPALVVTLAGSQRIDFGDYAHHAGDVSCFRLCAGHSPQAC